MATDISKTILELPPAEQAAYHATARMQAAKHALELSTQAADLDRLIRRTELSIKADIANEQDGNGKPTFSNAEKREAELHARTENHTVLTAAHEELEQLKRQAAEAEIDARYHADMRDALCRFAGSEREG